jgi:hypothetical protein
MSRVCTWKNYMGVGKGQEGGGSYEYELRLTDVLIGKDCIARSADSAKEWERVGNLNLLHMSVALVY